MKRILIYTVLWLAVAILWHLLKLFFGVAITVWYIKGLYTLAGILTIVFSGEYLYMRLHSRANSNKKS